MSMRSTAIASSRGSNARVKHFDEGGQGQRGEQKCRSRRAEEEDGITIGAGAAARREWEARLGGGDVAWRTVWRREENGRMGDGGE